MTPEAALKERRENRLEVKSIVLPFLGSRESDFSPFQYLLSNLSPHGAKILIPRWLAWRERLSPGEEIDFHAPFLFAGESYTRGEAAWTKWEEESDAQACGVHFNRKAPPAYPIFISMDSQSVHVDLTAFEGASGLLLRVLKDAFFLKRGIAIYLKHLSPYISRISGLDKEKYDFLRSFLLDDAAKRVRENQERLQDIYEQAQNSSTSSELTDNAFNPEEFLDIFEPEIPADVFNSSFVDKAVRPYLKSIKLLEKKLYSNYNTLVLLYLSSIQQT